MASRREKLNQPASPLQGPAEPRAQPSSVETDTERQLSVAEMVQHICSVMINDLRQEFDRDLVRIREENFSLKSTLDATVKELATARSDINKILEERVNGNQKVQDDISMIYDKLNNLEMENMHLSFATEKPTTPEPKTAVSFEQGSSKKHSTKSTKPAKTLKGKYNQKHRRHDETSNSSDVDNIGSSSSSQASSTDSESEDERLRRRRKSILRSSQPKSKFGERTKGARYPGLKSLQPTNILYKNVCSYRMYRLTDTTTHRSSRGTGKVRDYIKRMEIRLSQHHFSGKDPIMVLDFLSRFVREAEIQEMSEAQALLALPSFLNGFAKSQYEAAERVNPQDGGIGSWPEAVQYLLRNYAQNKYISSAIRDLRDTRQKELETEKEYAVRLNNAVTRCGNVHSSAEIVTMYIDGLHPAIRSLVTGYREATKKVTYLDIVDFASNHGDAVRAQQGTKQSSRGGNRNSAVTSPLLALHDDQTSSSTSNMPFPPAMGNDETVNLIEQGLDSSSAQTSLPSISGPPTDSDSLMALERQRMAYGPRVPGEDPHRRVGWVDRQVAPRVNRMHNPRDLLIICHECYEHGHIAPNCNLSVKNLYKVIINYEKLTPQEQSMVPSTSYVRVKRAFQPTNPEPDAQSTPFASAQGSPHSGTRQGGISQGEQQQVPNTQPPSKN